MKRAGVELVFAVLSVGGLAFGVTFFRKRVSFDFTLHFLFEYDISKSLNLTVIVPRRRCGWTFTPRSCDG